MRARDLIACLAATVLLIPAWTTGAGAATTDPAGTTTLSGTVDRVVVDRAGDDAAALTTRVLVEAGGRLLDVPPTLSAGLAPGQQVVVTVAQPGRRLAAASTRAVGPKPTVLSITPITPITRAGARAAAVRVAAVRAAAVASPVGAHTLTVLPVYWTARDSQTQASLTQLATQTAAYWSDQSGARIVVTSVVKDWAKITDPGSCDPGALFDRALAANGLAGPGSANQHVMIYFPFRSDCAWAGLGSISGSRIWDNGYLLTDVSAHELGHNFGIGHAQRAACTANGVAVPFSTGCQVQEYQDTADIMGFATSARSGNLNSALADWLGLAQTVTASASGTTTVDLAPLAQTGATRALKIDVGTGWVYVDFRPAAGRDLRMPNWAGVQVHYLPNGPYPQSQLLDLQAGQGPAFSRVSLPTWSVWPVPGAGVSVQVTATGGTASVRVTPTAGDTAAPSTPTLTLTRSANAPAAVTAGWTASTDTGSGIGSYTVRVDGAVVARTGPESRQAVVAVSGTAASVRVDAVDLAGNVSSSAPVAIPGASGTGSGTGTGSETGSGSGSGSPGASGTDPTPPSTPAVLTPATGRVLATRQLRWSWSAATDEESGVAGYRLYADHVAISGILPATTVVQVTLPEGTTVLGVVAVNGAGTASAAAESSVTVDSVAPAAPARLALSGTGLTWGAPTDSGTALAYLVSQDGRAPTRTTATSLPVAAGATGRHTWTVRAVDLAGNTSAAATVTVAVRGRAVPQRATSRSTTRR